MSVGHSAGEKRALGGAGHSHDLARQRHLLADTLQAAHAGVVTFDQAAAVEKAVRPLPDPAKPDAVALLTGLAQVTDAAAVRVAGRRCGRWSTPTAR